MKIYAGVISIFYLALNLLLFGAEAAGTRQTEEDRPVSLGIDQTEIIGRYSANYVYVEKDNGTERHNLGLGLDKDISDSAKLGFVIPVTYAETGEGDSAEGIGDVKLNAGWRFYHTPGLSALEDGSRRGVDR